MATILLKTLLTEAKLYAYSIPELLEKFLTFEGKTLVLVDSETAGLEPNTSYVQLTHLAAMAFDGSTMQMLGEFDRKVSIGEPLQRLLSDPASSEATFLKADAARRLKKYKKADKTPAELLQMTGYHSNPGKAVSEKDALVEFEQFLGKFHNVILVAHNATFDLKAIQARRRFHGLPPLQRYPVLDTLKIARFFFIPVLLSLESVPEVKRLLDGLLAKTKYKSYSSSLGRLAQVLGVKMDQWHDAKEDVMMLMAVLQQVITFLRTHANADIRNQQGRAAKRFRKL